MKLKSINILYVNNFQTICFYLLQNLKEHELKNGKQKNNSRI